MTFDDWKAQAVAQDPSLAKASDAYLFQQYHAEHGGRPVQESPSTGPGRELVGQAREHMDSGEEVLAYVAGTYETKLLGNDAVRSGVLIATEKRVVFYAKKFFGYDFEVFPYTNISSIEGGKNFMGHHITLFASGNKAHMKWIQDAKSVAHFTATVRDRIGKKEAAAAPASDGIINQIRKLGELRDAGILTEEEFSTKKTELLARL